LSLTDTLNILYEYHAALEELRQKTQCVNRLPPISFFLFGMGPRRKLIYQSGLLKDARTGEILRSWDVAEEKINPPAYRVQLQTTAGQVIAIIEDETGIWLEEGSRREAICLSRLHLPTFGGHKYASVLRVLHQEILINIVDGLPVPNFFVYRKPWYRDSAIMAMVLKKTGNLDLIRDWILNLRDPYDRNNAGETEADNLGQALYLISLVSDRSHPLTAAVLEQLPKFQYGNYIQGRSDFANHPVYQTKWAKFGLTALGLADPYEIPLMPDSYSALFWWAYKDRHLPGARFNETNYPYLDWAESHFYGENCGPLGDRDYPLSWEAKASQADYDALSLLSPLYVERKLSAPHTWHAAEMFLALLGD